MLLPNYMVSSCHVLSGREEQLEMISRGPREKLKRLHV